VKLTRDLLSQAVSEAFAQAQREGEIPAFSLPPIVMEKPRQGTLGDYATAICLQVGRLAGLAPATLAHLIAKRIALTGPIGRVEVAGPGFINITLSASWLVRQVDEILAAGQSFGMVDAGKGLRVQVEYGSANPTGPLHVGFARNVVIGDTLANILAAAGYSVEREYYVNDAGTQMQLFGQSLYARYAQALGLDVPLPENGYQGQYLVEWGKEIAATAGRRYLDMPYEEAVAALTELGLKEKVLKGVQEDLSLLGVKYDNWFFERSLYASGTFEEAMALLRQRGYLEERDGAIWFLASRFGEDKDAVVIRSNGLPGYFASDIAYHYDKFVKRGFDVVVDVWGADHQGHVPRMKAVMAALGLDPERLHIVIYQLVTLKRGGEIIRISKRTGDLVTLRELLEEVGPDAVRYFLLSRAPDSQMEFDLELAARQTEENPVFYVQYAHARIASVLRLAQRTPLQPTDGDVSLLEHPSELNLIRQMIQLPEVICDAARDYAPHRLAYYAYELARSFHTFYRDCRILSSLPQEEALTKARLKLTLAAKLVLARVLALMGMSAPERM
jgi:arginyl-tRNA synthetase